MVADLVERMIHDHIKAFTGTQHFGRVGRRHLARARVAVVLELNTLVCALDVGLLTP